MGLCNCIVVVKGVERKSLKKSTSSSEEQILVSKENNGNFEKANNSNTDSGNFKEKNNIKYLDYDKVGYIKKHGHKFKE